MKKVIRVDLYSEDDLYEKYNDEKVSKDLIKYLIDSVSKIKREDEIEVNIYNHYNKKEKCIEFIKKGLDEECAFNERKFHITNQKQISFFIVGAFALFLSTIVEAEVLKEIILIGAWVLLWDMVELEIVDDMSNRKKKRILKKLLSSEFIEQTVD